MAAKVWHGRVACKCRGYQPFGPPCSFRLNPTGTVVALMAAQNIYDDPDFFAGYSQLPRSTTGLAAVYEWPAFQRLAL